MEHLHWRIQNFNLGGPHSQRGARAYNGGLGAEPQRGPWAEPLVMGSVGRSPLKLKAF